MPLSIVLVQPEIPGNTGAVGRTCVALDAELVLIRPLGFVLSDARLPFGDKRVPAREFGEPHVRPVVEPRALHPRVRDREPEWVDQHQLGIERNARASDSTGVAGNLGLDEDDAQRHRATRPASPSALR